MDSSKRDATVDRARLVEAVAFVTSDTSERIIAALRDGKTHTHTDVMRKAMVSQGTLYKYVNDNPLIERGKIKVGTRWQAAYRLKA